MNEETKRTERPWTPGPWVADDNEGYGQWTIWEGRSPTGYLPPGRMIAKVIGDCCQSDADVRLIAAAPELFEALERILLFSESHELSGQYGQAVLDELFEIETQARAAIEKAEGGQP